MPGGWDEVDRTAEPQAYIDYLRTVSPLDSVRGVKRKSFQLMAVRPGNSVLDVGCRAGDEVIALARIVGDSGRAVGVDMSETMVSEGRRRAAEVRCMRSSSPATRRLCPSKTARSTPRVSSGRCSTSPIRTARSASFGGAVPAGASSRSILTGGSLVIDSEDEEMTRLLTRVHATHIAHGQMGRELWRRLGDAGFEDLVAESVIAQPRPSRSPMPWSACARQSTRAFATA